MVISAGDITPELRESIRTNAADVLASNPEVADLVENSSDGEMAREVRTQALEMRATVESDLGGWCLCRNPIPVVVKPSPRPTPRSPRRAPSATRRRPTDYIVKDVFIKGGKEPCAPITEQSTIAAGVAPRRDHVRR